jgi:DNA-binding MarR family transcriptional regulator
VLGAKGRSRAADLKHDPSDRRATLVQLTERGDAAIREIRDSVMRLEDDWEHELGSVRFAQFCSTLRTLAAAAGSAQ